jgi:hypothetical protein
MGPLPENAKRHVKEPSQSRTDTEPK